MAASQGKSADGNGAYQVTLQAQLPAGRPFGNYPETAFWEIELSFGRILGSPKVRLVTSREGLPRTLQEGD